MKIGPESLALIEAALSDYLKRPVWDDAEFAAQHQAVPLYAGWIGTTYLTTSGEFWFRNCEYDPPHIENDLNESSKIVALVVAAERHPALVRLLPPRPATAIDCDACGGGGRITFGTVSNIICGECSGLGWRPASALRETGSYPTFDVALAKFRAFAGELGHPTTLTFLSPEHALLIGDQLFVTAGSLCSDAVARSSYERAVGCRFGVTVGALGELPDGRLGAYIYGPATENEAERLMYPNGLKMTIPERKTRVRVVGRARMWLLRLRHARRVTERTREYFR